MEPEKEKILSCPMCGKSYPDIIARGKNWQVVCGYPCSFAALSKPTREEAIAEWNRIVGMWSDTIANRSVTIEHLSKGRDLCGDIMLHVQKAGEFSKTAGRLEDYGILRAIYKDVRFLRARIDREIESLRRAK